MNMNNPKYSSYIIRTLILCNTNVLSGESDAILVAGTKGEWEASTNNLNVVES